VWVCMGASVDKVATVAASEGVALAMLDCE
jgi:hypothetical protein